MSVKLDKEQVIGAVKNVGGFVAASTSMSLVCGLTRLVVPPQVHIVVKGAMCLGGIIVGGFLGDKTCDYMKEQIDNNVTMFEDGLAKKKHALDVIQGKNLTEENPEKEE